MDNHQERWISVPGYEGLYEVSDMGRVRSLDRVVIDKQGTRKRSFKGKMLKPQNVYTGYTMVALSKDGKVSDWYIHRLVLTAFRGEPAPGAEGCHNNDIRSDNRLENLRWDSHLENVRDAFRRNRMRNHNRERTHCRRGHPFNETNTIVRPDGRGCKTCKLLTERIRYHKAKNSVNTQVAQSSD